MNEYVDIVLHKNTMIGAVTMERLLQWKGCYNGKAVMASN